MAPRLLNSDTSLTAVNATSLDLTSDGTITDAIGTTVTVTGQASIDAGGNSILLGDNATDVTNFGSLDITGGTVTITEDSDTELSNLSATDLTLSSGGAISDASNTNIAVTNQAALTAATGITLGDQAGDTTNFGSLGLSGTTIVITEDSDTLLTTVNATSLNLTSDGAVTDATGTNLTVTGLASIDAGGNLIVLGDDGTDVTNFGSLDVTGGTVTITEDSDTSLTAVNATSLDLTSDGTITDAIGTTVTVTGQASIDAGGNSILLGDDGTDVTNFGSLDVTGGTVTITENSDTELSNLSATDLTLSSGGAKVA